MSLDIAAAAPTRSRGRQGGGVVRRLRPAGDTTLAMLLTVLAWELVSRSGWFGAALPPVSDTFAALRNAVSDDQFAEALWSTVAGWFTGLVIACVIAIPAGLVVGSSNFLARSTRLTVDFLRTIPPVVYIPLLLLTFGATPDLKVVLIVLGAVWPLFVQSTYAIREVDPLARDGARAMRLGPVLRARSVLLPSALPFLFTGLRVAASFSLLFALAAELLGGAPGIGRQMALAQIAGDSALAFAYLLVSGALGVAINVLMLIAQRRVLAWHPSVRGRER